MAQQILEAAEQAAAEERAAQQLLGKSAHVKKVQYELARSMNLALHEVWVLPHVLGRGGDA